MCISSQQFSVLGKAVLSIKFTLQNTNIAYLSLLQYHAPNNFMAEKIGPLLALNLICSCFRENEFFVYMHNCAFLCSLYNFLFKNVIVFIFGQQNLNYTHLKKKKKKKKKTLFLNIFHPHCLITREKSQKIPSAHNFT